MRLSNLCLGLAALMAAACSQPATESPQQSSTATVFEGARLLDGNGGDPIEGAVLVVDNGRSQRSAPAAASRPRPARPGSI